MWVAYTFGLQKHLYTILEEHYYTLNPWIIVQRITLPVIIFFRFHSLVLLVELWKNSYRAEHEDEKRFVIGSHCLIAHEDEKRFVIGSHCLIAH